MGLFRVTQPFRCNYLIIFWRLTLLLQHKGQLCTIINWKKTKLSLFCIILSDIILDISNYAALVQGYLPSDLFDSVASWVNSVGPEVSQEISQRSPCFVLFVFLIEMVLQLQ